MQELPRVFLVVVPMLISVLMMFAQFLRREMVLYIESAYLLAAGFVLYQYMIRVRNRGVKNLFHKIR